MKEILVLGAGMVSKPLVRYILEQTDYFVKIATRTISKAEKIIDSHPHGEAHELDVHDNIKLEKLIAKSDIVVSLLPYTYHVRVAHHCLKHKKHMITTSYVNKEMQELDKKAKNMKILILNECGLDPGIDHMSAMRIIHKIKDNNGKIKGFSSYCGALPSLEANNNPMGYKFSWSPRGVLLASKNSARYLKNGKEIKIPGEKLFEHYTIKKIDGIGHFENYPNRDSIPYIQKYGIPETQTMYRGTLRHIGWCETMKKIADLGYLDETKIDDLEKLVSYRDLTRKLIKNSKNNDLKKDLARYLNIETYSAVMKKIEWLGLLSNKKLPENQHSPLDILNTLAIEKLRFENGERDMVILHHEFTAEYPSKKEHITSTMIEYGIPYGDTAVARTVGLPAAIATKMILEEKIETPGVHIPITPEIYNPILDELEHIGIVFNEKTEAESS